LKKRYWALPTVLITLGLLQFFDFSIGEAETGPGPQLPIHRFVVDTEPVNRNAMRIGVNLGAQSNWGVEQFSRNSVYNPGFEGNFTRFIVIVSQADYNSFSNEGWEHPDGFWKGATFDIRTGAGAGTQGKISDSLKAGVNGQPQYFTEAPLPKLEPRDVIVLTKENVVEPPSNWWTGSGTHEGISVSKDHPPNSPGIQSAVLTPNENHPTSLRSYFDNAGKYLKVDGRWHLSFWAKAEGKGAQLQVVFRRMNKNSAFLVKEIQPTHEWQLYDFEFIGHDTGAAAILALEFAALPSVGTKIYLDDVWLGSVEDNSPLAFRKEVVDLLKQLHPSYLRDWEGQISDSFANRIAPPFARKGYGSPPPNGQIQSLFWSYSLPEFLDLCEAVGADPWIVIPTVFSDQEYRELGKFLSVNAPKTRFSDVILEFGYENWNWAYRPSGIPYADVYGPVAERAFKIIKSGIRGDVHLTKAISGQHVNPYVTFQYASNTPSADLIAVDGYYLSRIDAGVNRKNAVATLFSTEPSYYKETLEGLKLSNKPLAIYEINAHTTEGTATEAERNPYVAGALSGAVLAKHLLDGLFLSIQPEMVFTFSGLDTNVWINKTTTSHVKLWGITVDLSPTKRFRPTGLAVKMLNHVIGGELYKAKREGFIPLEQITMGAFKQGQKWSLAAISEINTPQFVDLTFPDDNIPLPETIWVLHSNNPFEMNEEAENVKIIEHKIEPKGRSLRFSIPAYGLIVAF